MYCTVPYHELTAHGTSLPTALHLTMYCTAPDHLRTAPHHVRTAAHRVRTAPHHVVHCTSPSTAPHYILSCTLTRTNCISPRAARPLTMHYTSPRKGELPNHPLHCTSLRTTHLITYCTAPHHLYTAPHHVLHCTSPLRSAPHHVLHCISLRTACNLATVQTTRSHLFSSS